MGQFINVSSIADHLVSPTAAVYSATKFAVRAISDRLRQEVGPDIRVTINSPGVVESELAETISDGATRQMIEEFRANAIPAAAIAQAIRFAIAQPRNVDVSEMIVRPAGGH